MWFISFHCTVFIVCSSSISAFTQYLLFFNVCYSSISAILQCLSFFNVYHSSMYVILQCLLFFKVCYSSMSLFFNVCFSSMSSFLAHTYPKPAVIASDNLQSYLQVSYVLLLLQLFEHPLLFGTMFQPTCFCYNCWSKMIPSTSTPRLPIKITPITLYSRHVCRMNCFTT